MVGPFGKSILITEEEIGAKEISGRWSQKSSFIILDGRAKRQTAARSGRSFRPGTGYVMLSQTHN